MPWSHVDQSCLIKQCASQSGSCASAARHRSLKSSGNWGENLAIQNQPAAQMSLHFAIEKGWFSSSHVSHDVVSFSVSLVCLVDFFDLPWQNPAEHSWFQLTIISPSHTSYILLWNLIKCSASQPGIVLTDQVDMLWLLWSWQWPAKKSHESRTTNTPNTAATWGNWEETR